MVEPGNIGPAERDRHALFVQYFAREHRRIYNYIYSLLPNRADADDVFQQTSFTLWNKFSEFDQDRDFCAWACGIAFYTVKNFLRVAGRRPLRFSDELLKVIADEREASDHTLSCYGEYLEECLSRLSSADRQLVRRAYAGEHTIKEIAHSTGRAVQTVYNRLNWIRRKLFECIDRKAASS